MIRGAGRYSTLITPAAGSLFHAEFHHRERWGAFRFDANDLDLTAEPPGNSGN
jgi:hypothetical protein